jgi:hypothetical protein
MRDTDPQAFDATDARLADGRRFLAGDTLSLSIYCIGCSARFTSALRHRSRRSIAVDPACLDLAISPRPPTATSEVYADRTLKPFHRFKSDRIVTTWIGSASSCGLPRRSLRGDPAQTMVDCRKAGGEGG